MRKYLGDDELKLIGEQIGVKKNLTEIIKEKRRVLQEILENEKNVAFKEVKLKTNIMNFEVQEKDLHWCQRLISDVKDSGLVPDKQEFIMANLMWKKYGFLPTDRKSTEENMWKLIDGMLTQENPSKIGAIKMYRRFITNASLRESKEVVDAREQKIKRGW